MIHHKERTVRFNSSFENLYHLEKFIDEICDDYHIKNTYFGNISVVLNEAVGNAIIHGNKGDISKMVEVSFQNLATGLFFRVADEGQGFEYYNIPEPVSETTNPIVFPGKGLYLIKTLADSVSFNTTGNVIEIQFNISSINHETSVDRAQKLNAYFKTFEEAKKLKATSK